jgi:hypothetical protein
MTEEKEIRTLRDMVECNGDCAHRFNQAKMLADSLFERTTVFLCPWPFYAA